MRPGFPSSLLAQSLKLDCAVLLSSAGIPAFTKPERPDQHHS